MVGSKVWFDITVGGVRKGRILFQLYNETTPRTAENFRQLCTGEGGIGASGKPLHFKGSIFHRCIPNFMLQGGDFTNFNGTGGESIYGMKFDDENFIRHHDKPFLLSMANSGKNTNGSQFFITVTPTPHLDGKHVVFGQVIKGMGLVKYIENLPTKSDKPDQDVTIVNCGELKEGESDGFEDPTGDNYPDFLVDNDGWTAEKIIAAANEIKGFGNKLFTQADGQGFDRAFAKYDKAINFIDFGLKSTSEGDHPSPDEERDLSKVKITLLLNRAQCGLKLKQYSAIDKDCDLALSLTDRFEPSDKVARGKAYFRKGEAAYALKDLEAAGESFNKALANQPDDKATQARVNQLKQLIASAREAEVKKYSKMFD